VPLVELTTTIPEYLELGIAPEASMGDPFSFFASAMLGIDLLARISTELSAEVDFGVDIDPDSVLRLNAEVNVSLEAETDFGFDFDEDTIVSLVFEFLAIFQLGVDLTASSAGFSEVETDELNLTVNIFPSIALPANYQEYKVRFKIDGVEIPISAFQVKAAPNKIGTDVSVTLSDNSDRTLVTRFSIYTLEIGVVVNDVVTWYTIASGQLSGDTFTIGWEKNAPTDSVSLSHSALISNAINISPLLTTVLYDPTDRELSADDFPAIYDVNGNPYPVILLPSTGLTLYTILGFVFSACGLSFFTNIPNFRIKRIDIEIGQSYYQAISQLFGVFEPILLERDGVVYILDSTMLSVSGFDAPISISPSTYKSISASLAVDRINGYIVNYNESQEAWDSYEDTSTFTSNSIIDIDEEKETVVETTTFIRNYKRLSIPGLVVRAEVTRILTETYVIDGVAYNTEDPVLINRTDERFTYDHTGKVLRRTKTEDARIPIWYPSTNPESADGDGFWEYDFQNVRYEQDDSVYKVNPFKHGTEYRETLSQFARSLVYIDPDKIFETIDEAGVLDIDPDREVPVDYKQEYVNAYRSGNLSEDGETEFSPVMSRLEKVIPINKDFSRVETKEIDFLTKVVDINVSEEQIGEIATSSQVSLQKRFIVYGYGQDRTTGRLDSLNIGEVPLVYGIALAQRKIARVNTRQVNLSMNLIGFDPIIDRGNTVKVIGRDSENLGNYLLEGYTIDGKQLGTPRQLIETLIDALLT
jgi:hypothetical protein